jgi:hypothetical protein
MKTITVADLRESWSRTEAMLKEENQLLVTNAGVAVATLSAIPSEPKASGEHFNLEEHRRWKREVFGDEPPMNIVDQLVAEDRDEP